MQSYKQAKKQSTTFRTLKSTGDKKPFLNSVHHIKIKKAIVYVTGHKDYPELSGIAKNQPLSCEFLAKNVKPGFVLDETKRKLKTFDLVYVTDDEPNSVTQSDLQRLAKIRGYKFLRVNIKEKAEAPVQKVNDSKGEPVKGKVVELNTTDIPKPKRKYTRKSITALGFDKEINPCKPLVIK